MGLDEIIRNIELETRAKTKRINDDALLQSRKITDAAEDEAEAFLEEARAKAESEARQLSLREQSRANIEAKGIYQRALNDAVEKSFATLQENIGDYLGGADYTRLLAKLVKMAGAELGSGCTIFVQSADMQKVKDAGIKVQEAKEHFAGGIRGLSRDGKMYVDYSIEKIIESLKEAMAVKILDTIKD